jgi:prepilin-type N-terminal cleavage/methylation domain-containing protein
MKGAKHPEQGMALIEVLIASAVLGIGLLGATQLTLKTLHLSRESRLHAAAQRLAQEGLDCLVASIHNSASPCPPEETILIQGVRYSRLTSSAPRGNGHIQDLQVRVTWTSSTNNTQGTATSATSAVNRIEWHSSVSALPAWVSGR